jgi:hypothetical protein
MCVCLFGRVRVVDPFPVVYGKRVGLRGAGVKGGGCFL